MRQDHSGVPGQAVERVAEAYSLQQAMEDLVRQVGLSEQVGWGVEKGEEGEGGGGSVRTEWRFAIKPLRCVEPSCRASDGVAGRS